MAQKQNPRKRVITEAELRKAVSSATLKTMKLADILFMTVLLDKFDFSIEDLNKAWNELGKLTDEVKEKRINVHDLKTVLKEEYYIDVDE